MRHLIKGIAAVLALAIAGAAFGADGGSIRFMVPAGLGTEWDITARSLGAAMRTSGIISDSRIDRRAGGNGIIGLNQFYNTNKGKDDTLLVGGLVMVSATELAKTPVGLKQLAPVAMLLFDPEVIVVSAKSKVRNIRDLADALKADPARFFWSGGQAGGIDHILVALLAKELRLDPAKMNYLAHSNGVEALGAVFSGRAAAGLGTYGDLESMIRDGRLRAIAVSSGRRIPIAPDTPTLKEQGINIDFVNWRAVFGAPGLTITQRGNLSNKVTDSLGSPAWQQALKVNGWTPSVISGDEFGRFVDAETTRVAQALRDLALVQ